MESAQSDIPALGTLAEECVMTDGVSIPRENQDKKEYGEGPHKRPVLFRNTCKKCKRPFIASVQDARLCPRCL